MSTDRILIRGAREHNLKNLTLELPGDKMIVFTGISGSGRGAGVSASPIPTAGSPRE
jgi:excinuclease ABC subunit A